MADPYPTTTPDKDLRRDIRRVTSILGETLARTEGDDLLALVEQVRAHAKEDRLDQLPDFDLATITRLVRAFTAYFHLANITEQVHRGRTLTRLRDAEGGWLEQAVTRIADAGTDPADVAGVIGQLGLRPVFTAHPTEVARRSTIDKLRRVAALLEEPDSPRRTRRLEEAVALLWVTDEIRIEPPEPTDEARNVVYYLEGLAAGVHHFEITYDSGAVAVGGEISSATGVAPTICVASSLGDERRAQPTSPVSDSVSSMAAS